MRSCADSASWWSDSIMIGGYEVFFICKVFYSLYHIHMNTFRSEPIVTPFWCIACLGTFDTISRIFLVTSSEKYMEYSVKDTPLFRQVAQQMQEYFWGDRQCFDIPLQFNGSAFQQRVWWALMHIPYAQTCSYSALAWSIENPRACRAVGTANRMNPLPIIIPCHRVIPVSGCWWEYAWWSDIKRFLCEHELRTLHWKWGHADASMLKTTS
jgi:methylated-DNA-[protein]-cysteine S-methyltransferase